MYPLNPLTKVLSIGFPTLYAALEHVSWLHPMLQLSHIELNLDIGQNICLILTNKTYELIEFMLLVCPQPTTCPDLLFISGRSIHADPCAGCPIGGQHRAAGYDYPNQGWLEIPQSA